LTGRTYDFKEKIKSLGGQWQPAEKCWKVPAGADLSFLVPPPPPRPRTREEWTMEEWTWYCIRHRSPTGPCCKNAKSFQEYEQGPVCYRCERHGVTHNNYTGD
jgi:hypothetical protein